MDIGISPDNPCLKIQPELYEAIKERIGKENASRIIVNNKIILSAVIKNINKKFADLSKNKKGFQQVVFNEDVLLTGGELCFSPAPGENGTKYSFPKTVIRPESVCIFKHPEGYILKIDFELHEDSDGVLMRKFFTKLKTA
jgi:hypothetical protein